MKNKSTNNTQNKAASHETQNKVSNKSGCSKKSSSTKNCG